MKEIKLNVIHFENEDIISTSSLCAYTGDLQSYQGDGHSIMVGENQLVYLYDKEGNLINTYNPNDTYTLNQDEYYHTKWETIENKQVLKVYECEDPSHYGAYVNPLS